MRHLGAIVAAASAGFVVWLGMASAAGVDTGASRTSIPTQRFAANTPPAKPAAAAKVDINVANAEELQTLKGVGEARAKDIIAGRPYKDPGDLVTRKILTKAVFDPIKASLIATPIPAKTDAAAGDDKSKTAAAGADTAKTDPAKTDVAKTDVAKTDAAKTDAAKTDAGKTDAAKTTKTVKVEPPKVGTPTSNPAKGEFGTVELAKAHCPTDTVVWANLSSKIFHYAGTDDFGKTKTGTYMCEKEAVTAKIRAAANEKRP